MSETAREQWGRTLCPRAPYPAPASRRHWLTSFYGERVFSLYSLSLELSNIVATRETIGLIPLVIFPKVEAATPVREGWRAFADSQQGSKASSDGRLERPGSSIGISNVWQVQVFPNNVA